MSDQELLLMCSAVVCVIVKKRKRRRMRNMWVKDWLLKRKQYSHVNILKELRFHPKDWYNYLRMDEETYLELLSLVSPLIKKENTNMRSSITPHERLTATLRYLATGRSLEDLKYSTIISPQSLGIIIQETCKAVVKVLKKDFCKFPSTEEEWREIGRGFNERWNFPNCLGAIDGKHIAIVPPPGSGSYFYNYKKYHSQVLLGIADYNYKLIYFSFGVNGRVSDGGVLSCSDINEKMLNKTLSTPEPTLINGTLLPYVFIADEAFELRENLMKPFNGSVLTYERRICNYRFSRARRIIENVFGILVARFGILQKAINLRLDRITDVVLACCTLHNFLRECSPNKYIPPENLDEENEGVITPGLRIDPIRNLQRTRKGTNNQDGKNVRETFVQYFNGTGKVPWQDNYA